MTSHKDISSEMIQVCTDLYYECKTIKELDRLTDKALDLVAQAEKEVWSKIDE